MKLPSTTRHHVHVPGKRAFACTPGHHVAVFAPVCKHRATRRTAATKQDTRYKMVLLPFDVYNYTHIRHYSHKDMHSI